MTPPPYDEEVDQLITPFAYNMWENGSNSGTVEQRKKLIAGAKASVQALILRAQIDRLENLKHTADQAFGNVKQQIYVELDTLHQQLKEVERKDK